MGQRKDGQGESSRAKLFRLLPPTIAGKVTVPAVAFDATKPLLIVRNRADQKGTHSFRDLLIRRIGAGGGIVDVGIFVDPADRYVTGGTPRVPASPNADPGLGATPPDSKISEAFEVPTVTTAGEPARGTIQAVAGSQLVDTETFTLDDGANPADVFEFDSGGGVTGGNIAVAFTGGDDAATVAAAIIAAINGVAGTLLIVARLAPGSTTLIDLTNETGGVVGNVPSSDTVANVAFVVTGMAGGAVTVARLIAVGSVAVGDRLEKVIETAETAIIGSPGTLLIYAVELGGGTPDLAYGMDLVNRS